MALSFAEILFSLRMTSLSFHIARNRSELSLFQLLIAIPGSQTGLFDDPVDE